MFEGDFKHPHDVPTSVFREQGGDVSEFHFQFLVEGVETNIQYIWTNNFSTSTSSYTVRQSLSQIRQKTRGLNIDSSVWDTYIQKRGTCTPVFQEKSLWSVQEIWTLLCSDSSVLNTHQLCQLTFPHRKVKTFSSFHWVRRFKVSKWKKMRLFVLGLWGVTLLVTSEGRLKDHNMILMEWRCVLRS
jgi:hypothetical protein